MMLNFLKYFKNVVGQKLQLNFLHAHQTLQIIFNYQVINLLLPNLTLIFSILAFKNLQL